jgi:peptidyl-prolyl cis-trans isomerase A (cyclophilin A)
MVRIVFLLLLGSLSQSSSFTPSARQRIHKRADDRRHSSLDHAHPLSSRSSTSALYAHNPRRNVLEWIKRSLTFGLVAATGTLSSASPALATEEAVPGSLIELEFSNLDGIEGKTGTVKIQLYPEWAPKGVERFEELTRVGFWKDCRIFRVLPGFVVQFGINGDPAVQAKWRASNLSDDPVKVSNDRGTVTFATAGANTRTTQIFITTRDQGNAFLDKQGFAPIGKVVEGMDIVDRCYAGYGEGAPAGKGPNQGIIQLRGNTYLKDQYPQLSYISKAVFD